jgi:predicted transcriptional regulator
MMGAVKPTKRKKTAREIAEKLDVSERTVRRYIALPRTEYEANSISSTKPWEALGMSRSTWYRKGKPLPVSREINDLVALTSATPA